MSRVPRLMLDCEEEKDAAGVEEIESDEESSPAFPLLTSPLVRARTLDEYRDGSYASHLDTEWKELRRLCEKEVFQDIGYLPPKAVKNSRDLCKDVTPNRNTRVKLLKSPNPEQNFDYINANFISAPLALASMRKYIAAMNPTKQSVEEFWEMVWEQDVRLIMMLTNVDEDDASCKASRYWPLSPGESLEIDGDKKLMYDTVGMQKTVDETVIVRRFVITSNTSKDTKEITHLQFTNWPDKSIPEDKSQYSKVVQCYRNHRDNMDAKFPVLVHCTAGLGRTGTFLAIDMILDHIQLFRARNKNGLTEPSFSVASLVFELRKQRKNMVQNQKQYEFICDFIAHCAHHNEHMDVSGPMLTSPTNGPLSVSGRERSSSRGSRKAPLSTRASASSFFNAFPGVDEHEDTIAGSEPNNAIISTAVRRSGNRPSFRFDEAPKMKDESDGALPSSRSLSKESDGSSAKNSAHDEIQSDDEPMILNLD